MQTNNKLRDALDKIGNISAFVAENCGNSDTAKYMNDIISIVQEIVAEPVRNCDVGTSEEQAERFKTFCIDHQEPWHGCSNYCPVLMSEKCALAWAQMPYDEGGDM